MPASLQDENVNDQRKDVNISIDRAKKQGDKRGSTTTNVIVFVPKMLKYLLWTDIDTLIKEQTLDQGLFIFLLRSLLAWSIGIGILWCLVFGLVYTFFTGSSRVGFNVLLGIGAKDDRFIGLTTFLISLYAIGIMLLVTRLRRVVARKVLETVVDVEKTHYKHDPLWYETRTLFLSGIPDTDHEAKYTKQVIEAIMKQNNIAGKVEDIFVAPSIKDAIKSANKIKRYEDLEGTFYRYLRKGSCGKFIYRLFHPKWKYDLETRSQKMNEVRQDFHNAMNNIESSGRVFILFDSPHTCTRVDAVLSLRSKITCGKEKFWRYNESSPNESSMHKLVHMYEKSIFSVKSLVRGKNIIWKNVGISNGNVIFRRVISGFLLVIEFLILAVPAVSLS